MAHKTFPPPLKNHKHRYKKHLYTWPRFYHYLALVSSQVGHVTHVPHVPKMFWGKKYAQILHLRAAVASLNNPTAGWMFSTWLEAFALGPQAGKTNGDKRLAGENLDGMCEVRLSLKMVFPVFIFPAILPEKDWKTVGYVFFIIAISHRKL